MDQDEDGVLELGAALPDPGAWAAPAEPVGPKPGVVIVVRVSPETPARQVAALLRAIRDIAPRALLVLGDGARVVSPGAAVVTLDADAPYSRAALADAILGPRGG